MNKKIKEILSYLESRNDYVIWAGFAVFAHLGVKPSADVDIYTDKLETKKRISRDFQNKGWKKMPHPEVGFGWDWDKLEKEDTTFDIVYTPEAAKLLFKDMVELKVYNYKVRFLSREWLFLTKLGQLSWKNRESQKRKRDLETISRLRNLVDLKKLSKLAPKLPASYWLAGQI